jgi:IS4 transposase
VSNPRVNPRELAVPLLKAAHEAVERQDGEYVLCIHDGSRLNYGSHEAKRDRLQMSHQCDVGYELQSSLLVGAEDGAPIPGAPLALRLVVSRLYDARGQVLAEWYLLSALLDAVSDAQIALWYYFRWQIESFFKLLKQAGHPLERWEQESGSALFK